MALDPAPLVLDEPTSMLDALTLARIIRLLQSIQRQSRIAYILIRHNADLVHQVCNRVLEMKGGLLLRPFAA